MLPSAGLCGTVPNGFTFLEAAGFYPWSASTTLVDDRKFSSQYFHTEKFGYLHLHDFRPRTQLYDEKCMIPLRMMLLKS